jgi:ABC-type multidrug transport system fused ATPase/permease subunit
MSGRTTILITHRMALAETADRVVVLGDGGIVEQGEPAELLARGGAFASLFLVPPQPTELLS